jgi:hypothetical protein
MNEAYREQLRLMLDLLLFIAEESIFALKGGAASGSRPADRCSVPCVVDSPTHPVGERRK